MCRIVTGSTITPEKTTTTFESIQLEENFQEDLVCSFNSGGCSRPAQWVV